MTINFLCPRMKRKKVILIFLVHTFLILHSGKSTYITNVAISSIVTFDNSLKYHYYLLNVLVRGGNYYPCSWNPCGDHGQCISMYPSPNLQAYSLPVTSRYRAGSESLTPSIEEDIFLISPLYSRWEAASEFCMANDAALLDISVNNNIVR